MCSPLYVAASTCLFPLTHAGVFLLLKLSLGLICDSGCELLLLYSNPGQCLQGGREIRQVPDLVIVQEKLSHDLWPMQ